MDYFKANKKYLTARANNEAARKAYLAAKKDFKAARDREAASGIVNQNAFKLRQQKANARKNAIA